MSLKFFEINNWNCIVIIIYFYVTVKYFFINIYLQALKSFDIIIWVIKMQKILSHMRKAIEEYKMIEENDKIAIHIV